jgi:hypothetical protein
VTVTVTVHTLPVSSSPTTTTLTLQLSLNLPSSPTPEHLTTMMSPSPQQLFQPTWTKVSSKRGRSSSDGSERESKQAKESQPWLHPPPTTISNRFSPFLSTNNLDNNHTPNPALTPKRPQSTSKMLFPSLLFSSCWNKLHRNNMKPSHLPTTR